MSQIRGFLDVLREDGRSQAVVVLVGTVGNLLKALELLDGQHWAENLLSADLHVVRHISKDGRLKLNVN